MRLLLPVLLALAAPAAAQTDWSHARAVEVRLSNFDFTPAEIHLPADQPVVLRLTNTANGGHNFAAPEFFAAASVAGGGARIERGRIEVPEGRSVEVRLVPARGRYPLRCTHTLHTTFGMRGEIVVE